MAIVGGAATSWLRGGLTTGRVVVVESGVTLGISPAPLLVALVRRTGCGSSGWGASVSSGNKAEVVGSSKDVSKGNRTSVVTVAGLVKVGVGVGGVVVVAI